MPTFLPPPPPPTHVPGTSGLERGGRWGALPGLFILWMKKLRPREGCILGKGHIASVQRCQDQISRDTEE